VRVANDELQLYEALRTNRQTRHRRGELLIEGVRNIDQAVAAGWPIAAVLSYVGCRRSRWAESVVDASAPAPCIEFEPALFDRLTDRDERPELLLVGRKQTRDLGDLAVDDDLLLVVLDRPGSPGNVGTMLRSSDALGATALVLVGHGVDPCDPRVLRASAGSYFARPVIEVASAAELVAWLERSARPVTVIGTDERGDGVLGDVPLRRPLVVLMGNETAGLSRALRELATSIVSIPMVGSASSLNVAAAHAIVLYEIVRQSRLS
jgi:TrmH family RNA methyltransferase